MDNIHFGNAGIEGIDSKFWFVGHFMDKYIGTNKDIRVTSGIEVKWGIHKAGPLRDKWSIQHQETSMSILIEGKFRMIYPEKEYVLTRQGDYIIWGPNIPHKTYADEDCIVLTIRWPSIPEDTKEIQL